MLIMYFLVGYSQRYFSFEKCSERLSGLRSSEKELPERCSGALRHKNAPGYAVTLRDCISCLSYVSSNAR
jgi:hypothetical protein